MSVMSQALNKIRNIKRALNIDFNKVPDQSLECIISGRVRSLRSMKNRIFIDLVDGSTDGHLQVVVKRELLPKVNINSYLTCEGCLTPSRGEKQDVEFKVNRIKHLSQCTPSEFPLNDIQEKTKEGWYRRHLHLRSMAPHFASFLRVRSELELGLQMIMRQMDFFKVQAPSITSNDSEASCELFNLQVNAMSKHEEKLSGSHSISDDDECHSDSDSELSEPDQTKGFFSKDVFLTTSAQLHLESLAASLSRVYSLGPVFRAESSFGTRHLCEFSMLEAEEANVVKVEELMDRVETIIKFASQYVAEVSEHKSDFHKLIERYSHGDRYKKLANTEYPRISYSEALAILKREMSNSSINFGKDINKTHESILLKHCDNVPIFITDYPKTLKPFYMKSSSEQTSHQTVACFDLIAPLGGEICGGSLREDDLEVLKSNLVQTRAKSMDTFNWYLDLRRFGSFPHGGFGIGIERMIMSLIGIRNIKDTLPYPRWPGVCRM